MKARHLLLASMLASTISAGAVMAQNTQDHSQTTGQATPGHPSEMASSGGATGGATKQRTQGLPPGTKPNAYGSDWAKGQTAIKQQ